MIEATTSQLIDTVSIQYLFYFYSTFIYSFIFANSFCCNPFMSLITSYIKQTVSCI